MGDVEALAGTVPRQARAVAALDTAILRSATVRNTFHADVVAHAAGGEVEPEQTRHTSWMARLVGPDVVEGQPIVGLECHERISRERAVQFYHRCRGAA